MADGPMIVHVSWSEDDQELILPLTSRLEELKDELGIELEGTRHALGFGMDVRSQLEAADVILLMLSPAYLRAASGRVQIGYAHERKLKGATVVSILVREGGDLSKVPVALLPTLPSDGTSIADADPDTVYSELFD